MSLPPLPPGWTQHKAPQGHTYYWHKASKTSTYKRPTGVAPPARPAPPVPPPPAPPAALPGSQPRQKRKREKPVSKQPVPGAPGWYRITTNWRHRFFWHPDTKQSEWDPPVEIRDAAEQMERALHEGGIKRKSGVKEEPGLMPGSAKRARVEREGADFVRDQEVSNSRAKSEPQPEPEPEELKEEEEEDEEEDDDQAWQLQIAADMAAEAEAAEEIERARAAEAESRSVQGEPSRDTAGTGGEEEQPLGKPEAEALFHAMLTSLNGTPKEVNPMAPWEIEVRKFDSLEAYGLLSEQDREDAFNEWCKLRVREKRAACQAQAQTQTQTPDKAEPVPAVLVGQDQSSGAHEAYQSLLRSEVTSTRTKWDEFRKKHKRDRRFFSFGRDDREREKAFKVYLRQLGETKRSAALMAEEAFVTLLGERVPWSVQEEVQAAVRKAGDKEEKARIVSESWARSKVGLDKDERYDAVGSSTRRAQLWREWVLGSHGAPEHRSATSGASDSASAPAAKENRDKEWSQSKAEQALHARTEAVARQKRTMDLERRKAAGRAGHEATRVQYEQLLVDKVHDPYLPFSLGLSHSLWGGSVPLSVGEQEVLFKAHQDRLLARKEAQLDTLLARHTPSLASRGTEVVPLVLDDPDFEKAKLGIFVVRATGRAEDQVEQSLEMYFDDWIARRSQQAYEAFLGMLRENSFLEFWGRLQQTKRQGYLEGRGNEDAPHPGVDDEDEEMEQDLMGMKFDLDEVRAVLKDDARYRAFGHRPQDRDRWIESYLNDLRASKRAVRQKH